MRDIPPLDPAWFERAAAHQRRLTMPAGALGRLLDLGRQLAAVQDTLTPQTEPAAVVVMAADHGVAEEGISAYPPEVTGQMVATFLRGTAAINVLARRHRARVLVVDVGIRHPEGLDDLRSHPDFIGRFRVRGGTDNFLHGPAMSGAEVDDALRAGAEVATMLADDGVRVVALGEMGIGNTTAASALTAALLGLPADQVTGRGTGVSDLVWRHKIDVIERSLRRHGLVEPGGAPVRATDPLAAVAAVGGFEIIGLAGLALEAASRRMVVLLDGFISGVAGLVAARIAPGVTQYTVAAHLSVESGHRAVLAELGLTPLLDLGLRLGEGSGAALALTLVHSAADVMRDMATFDAAGVSDRPG